MQIIVQSHFEEPRRGMVSDEEPLIVHRRTEQAVNKALVVFVHGLGGKRYGPDATWGRFPQYIYEDFPNVDVGLYTYRTLLGRLKFWASVSLDTEAEVFAGIIRDASDYRPIILAGHSMGGLLCMGAIRYLVISQQPAAMARLGGLILMATPQTGSQRVPRFLTWLSKDFQALKPHGEFVAQIQRTFQDWIVVDEQKSEPGKYAIPTWAIVGASDFWVDKLSGTIGLPSARLKTVRGSHTAIVKPRIKEADAFRFVYQCIETSVKRSNLAPAPSDHAIEEEGRMHLDPIPAVGIFINRREFLEEVEKFIGDSTRRLLVVQGLSGVGKTSVAAEVVRQFRPHFKDVFWINCTQERASADVFLAQMHVFLENNGDHALRGLWRDHSPGGLAVKVNALISALDRNPFLLVFDELNNWLGATWQIKDQMVREILVKLLTTAHKGKLILISDNRPRLDSTGYLLPTGATLEWTVLGLPEDEAIELLEQSGLKGMDRTLLQKIVHHCSGHPAMLRIFADHVGRLHRDPNELLTARPEATFGDLLEQTIRYLGNESVDTLERLCIFRQPIARQDLATVGIDFTRGLVPLLDRFLAAEEQPGNRYSVTPVVKSFVRDKLPEVKLRELHSTAAHFYVVRPRPDTPKAFGDLLPALEEAYHRSRCGAWDEATGAVLWATSFLIGWGYVDVAEQEVLQVERNVKELELKARCSWTLGAINDLRANYKKALPRFEEAYKMAELSHNPTVMAQSLFRIGRIHNAQSDFTQAETYFERCITICRKYGVTDGWAGALLGLAWSRKLRGDSSEDVLRLFKESLDRAQQFSDFETESAAHRQIGFLVGDKFGNQTEAREHYEQARKISMEHNLAKELGAVYLDLGYLYDSWGEIDAAEDSCRRAIEVCQLIGDLYMLPNAYCNLGKVFESRENLEVAADWYGRARNEFARIGNDSGEAYACFRLGSLRRKQHNLVDAEQLLETARHLYEQHGVRETLADVMKELVEVRRELGMGAQDVE